MSEKKETMTVLTMSAITRRYNTVFYCRYLEDAIINLDPANPATHSHLPLVVGEVRKHLSKFLASYPSHVASRRVSLIIMAADNLMK